MLNQNTVVYQTMSDDPWMPAHTPIDDSNSSFVGDYDLNLLACAEQYQICNPNAANNSARCTQLSGQLPILWELASPTNTVGLNEYQQYTVNRIQSHASWMNIFNAVIGRGAAALNGKFSSVLSYSSKVLIVSPANEHTFSSVQTPIPSTQWHTEVSLWFSNCLAKLQHHMIEWATMPTDIGLASQSKVPITLVAPYETVMCTNQLIRSTSSYQSFSVLGFGLIIALCSAIIVLGQFVDSVGGWAQRLIKSDWRDKQWRLEETLQLHKAAYNAAGMEGVWEAKFNSVPRTVGGDGKMPPSSELWGAELQQNGGEEGEKTAIQETVLVTKQ